MHEHSTAGRRSSVSRQCSAQRAVSDKQDAARRDSGCSVKLSASCESVAADWTLAAPVADAVRFVTLFASVTAAPGARRH